MGLLAIPRVAILRRGSAASGRADFFDGLLGGGRLAQRHRLRPGAERRAAGAVAAEGAVGLGGDGVAALEHALGEVGQPLGERGDVARGEGGADRARRAARGTRRRPRPRARRRAARRARRRSAGWRSRARRRGGLLLAEPVALVVDDEHRAVGGAREHVDDAGDERAPGGVERERERGLAADRGRGGDARAQRRGAERRDDRADVLDVLVRQLGALLGGEACTASGGGGRGARSRGPRAAGGRSRRGRAGRGRALLGVRLRRERRLDGRKSKGPLEVEPIGAFGVLAERGVAQALRRGAARARARGRPSAWPAGRCRACRCGRAR